MERIRCHICEEEMRPEILLTHFPEGALPSRGYKCDKCGYELIPLEEVKRVQEEAERLGLYGAPNPLTRKITKSGNNLAFYIPREYEKELGLRKGSKIKLWIQDDRICMLPIE